MSVILPRDILLVICSCIIDDFLMLCLSISILLVLSFAFGLVLVCFGGTVLMYRFLFYMIDISIIMIIKNVSLQSFYKLTITNRVRNVKNTIYSYLSQIRTIFILNNCFLSIVIKVNIES